MFEVCCIKDGDCSFPGGVLAPLYKLLRFALEPGMVFKPRGCETILVSNRVWFVYTCKKLGIILRRNYFYDCYYSS